jgi:hypothetical protein
MIILVASPIRRRGITEEIRICVNEIRCMEGWSTQAMETSCNFEFSGRRHQSATGLFLYVFTSYKPTERLYSCRNYRKGSPFGIKEL